MTARYVLLAGQHIEGHGPDGHAMDAAGNKLETKILAGQTFESCREDYHIRWPEKFQRADQTTLAGQTYDAGFEAGKAAALAELQKQSPTISQEPTTPPPESPKPIRRLPPGVDSMGHNALVKLAENEEIDLTGVKTKDETLRVLKAWAGGV